MGLCELTGRSVRRQYQTGILFIERSQIPQRRPGREQGALAKASSPRPDREQEARATGSVLCPGHEQPALATGISSCSCREQTDLAIIFLVHALVASQWLCRQVLDHTLDASERLWRQGQW